MAPFWDYFYICCQGTLSYEIFDSGYYLEQVNAYIRRQRRNKFQGTWMMNVYYKEVLYVSNYFDKRVSSKIMLCASYNFIVACHFK